MASVVATAGCEEVLPIAVGEPLDSGPTVAAAVAERVDSGPRTVGASVDTGVTAAVGAVDSGGTGTCSQETVEPLINTAIATTSIHLPAPRLDRSICFLMKQLQGRFRCPVLR